MPCAAAGAGQGIGRAWAHALAEAGAAVAGEGKMPDLMLTLRDDGLNSAQYCAVLRACAPQHLTCLSDVPGLTVSHCHTRCVCVWCVIAPAAAPALLCTALHCTALSVADVDLSKAQQVAQELQVKGARSVAIQADVSSKKDCQR